MLSEDACGKLSSLFSLLYITFFMYSYHTVFYTECFPDKEGKNMPKIRLHLQTHACAHYTHNTHMYSHNFQIAPVLNVFSSCHLRQTLTDNLLQL